jgi:hypothetical protein
MDTKIGVSGATGHYGLAHLAGRPTVVPIFKTARLVVASPGSLCSLCVPDVASGTVGRGLRNVLDDP